jgi:diadenosine tetraphosphate (Ap4A) HIT family hydrolase
MVVSRRHVQNVSELDARQAAAFFDLYRDAERALLAAVGTDRAFAMKLGVAVPHLHFHLYPMSAAAVRDDFLAAVTMQSRDEPSPEEREALLATLRGNLRK